ncbi:MAG: cbb3-type cytochrome oxidase assembly protein CcoS [Rhodospirillaceae bacterium]|nr:MAG: cbb3-type cytochrome oxidase assembly protein CcoS [Rhodospirillaceae bacterium]
MSIIAYLLPAALGLGFIGLLAFLWSLRAGQYEDLDGAAVRALLDREPLPDTDGDKN